MGYWNKKEELSKRAKEHTEDMINRFSKEIEESVRETKVYDESFEGSDDRYLDKPEVILVEMTSTEAACEFENGRTCILNYASFKHPGGMFMEGSSAQEESLCHDSFLYNVIKEQANFYAYNNQHKNRSLYTNRALYSPNIRFEYNGYVGYFDVLTCAAPNFAAASKYQNVGVFENNSIMRDRVRYIVDVLNDNEVDVAILGAWGCGVFGQNPTDVAVAFKEQIDQQRLNVKTVVFAIPAGPNMEAFKKVFA